MANIKKLQEISKSRSAESLKKEQLYKENEKLARFVCGCENAKENGTCIESIVGCYRCELYNYFFTAMIMAGKKDEEYKEHIDELLSAMKHDSERIKELVKENERLNNEIKDKDTTNKEKVQSTRGTKKKTENKCPNYQGRWGCAISPLKQCRTCPDYKLYKY